jgi:hypothetical protein
MWASASSAAGNVDLTAWGALRGVGFGEELENLVDGWESGNL